VIAHEMKDENRHAGLVDALRKEAADALAEFNIIGIKQKVAILGADGHFAVERGIVDAQSSHGRPQPGRILPLVELSAAADFSRGAGRK
jgi:hypothetical protein